MEEATNERSTLELPGGRYRYLRDLGGGAVGRVVLVRDEFLERDVALKMLHPDVAGSFDLADFEREFRLLSRLEHPGLAKAYDFGWLGDRPFFTSEYVAGHALGERDREERRGELLRLFVDLVEAVAHLHRQGLLHLDIKPGNVLVRDEEASPCIKLIDLGLCRTRLDAEKAAPLRGSLPYLAPEYLTGASLGPWTDVYALGATFYRVLTGRFPRRGAMILERGERLGADELREAALSWEPAPPPPSEVSKSVGREWDAWILSALALDPGSRFRSAGEFLDEIRGTRWRPSGGERDASPSPPWIRGRRAELERLEHFLRPDSAAERVLALTAPRGAGASRLLSEANFLAQRNGLSAFLEVGYPGRPTTPRFLFRCLEGVLAEEDADRARRWRAFLNRLERPKGIVRHEVSESERRLRRCAELFAAVSSLSRPVALVIDGLQHFDEISVALAVDLVRYLERKAEGARPALRLIIGYREEGPQAHLLRELSEDLARDGLRRLVSLGPLDVSATFDLYRDVRTSRGDRPGRPGDISPLRVFEDTAGLPARIVALAVEGVDRAARVDRVRDAGESAAKLAGTPQEQEILLAAAFVDRPFTEAEMARWTRLSRARVRRCLSRLAESGRLQADPAEPLSRAWILATPSADLVAAAPPGRRRAIHESVARDLVRGRRRANGPASVEAFRHFRLAGLCREAIACGSGAVDHLAATFQNRAALGLIEELFKLLRRSDAALRSALVLEAADLCGRIGDTERGLDLVRGELGRGRGRQLSPEARLRVRLRLASLYARRGDFRHGDRVFTEVFAENRRLETRRRGAVGIETKEYLCFLNEHAALKTFIGQHESALVLCDAGLRAARRRRSFSIREAALNFHATRANVYLRQFRSESAISSYERALEIAESIGSEVNRAVILNNLGIVHMQLERNVEAVQLFREAEKLCLRLEEGPSLVSIYCNLALLHARRGEADLCDDVLARARTLEPGAMGDRHAFFVEHATGVSLLYRGRYGEALERLDGALGLAAAREDRYVADYDRVFRAECLIQLARYREADEALTVLAEQDGASDRFSRMTNARRRFLHAISGGALGISAVQSGKDAEGAGDAVESAGPVPTAPSFLDALDGLYLDWAASIEAASRATRTEWIEAIEQQCDERGYRPLRALARWIRAERALLEGDPERALEAAAHVEEGANALVDALLPLLRARAASLGGVIDRARVADSLAKADVALASILAPEWRLRAIALRENLLPRAPLEASAAATRPRCSAVAEREEVARRLPAARRRRYVESDHWRAWVEVPEAAREEAERLARDEAAPRAEGASAAELPAASRAGAKTEPLRAPPRAGLVCRSPAMRTLSEALDRLRSTEIHVLIRGETGSGKELIARIIHSESRRGAGPFQVVDCAAVAEGVLDAELFGVEAGAFTDARSDRTGLLRGAEGGTVFFDDIVHFSLEAQAKLLRVVATGAVRPVGSERELPVDVRFLFATTCDLAERVRSGRFREDLYHRVHVAALTVPPLRERAEDIAELSELTVAEETRTRVASGAAFSPPTVEPDAIDALRERSWSGNVRELRNLLLRVLVESPERITRAEVARAADDGQTRDLFPPHVLASRDFEKLRTRLEREFFLHHYRRLGSADALASFLGLGRRQLYRRCDRLGISLRAARRSWRSGEESAPREK